MPTYTQKGRPLAVTTPLGEDALLLVGLEGTEGLSRPFSFRLDVLGPEKPIEFQRLLGQSATVRLDAPGSGKRVINGIVSRLTEHGRVYGRKEGGNFIRYRMELVPRLWLLTRRLQSRIFQHLSVPDMLKAVLQGDWGLEIVHHIQQKFAPRVRCVQYRETDLAFVSRLMEEEGIHYSFEHTEDAHRIVLSDAQGAPPTLQGPSPILFDDAEGGERKESRVTAWEKTQEIRARECTLWDHSFQLPGQSLQAIARIQANAEVGKTKHVLDLPYRFNNKDLLEIYEYPGNYAQRFDGIDRSGGEQPQQVTKIFDDNARTAKIRIEQEAAQALLIEGASNVGHLQPGYQFSLDRHYDANGSYLLTSIDHACRLEGTYLTSSAEAFHYSNRFRCLPLSVPFKPPSVTPRPTVKGTQTARVVGPKGSQIHCDKYGRIKVQFNWDRTDYDKAGQDGHVLHDSSSWVRVSQTWAGKGFGAIHIPRVGQEVIVDFLEGDPDKPIVVGTVYNADQMPPFTLPDHRSHYGLKTRSVGGTSDDFSHLTFEEYLGGEHVHLHSQKDMTHSTENHLVQNVANQHHVHVGSHARRQVGSFPGREHSYWIGKDDVVGALPVGSGSGGGPGDDNDNTAATSPNPPYYSISPSSIFTGWAKNEDVTYGWRTGNTCGLYTTLKLGLNLSTTLNPYALEDFSPKLGAVFQSLAFGAVSIGGLVTQNWGAVGASFATAAVGVLARNAMGAGNVIIGANSTIHYGRKIDVSHGATFDARKKFSVGQALACIAAGTAYNALVLSEAFLPTPVGAVVTEAVLIPTLFSVWAALESEMTLAQYIQISDKWVSASLTNPAPIGMALGASSGGNSAESLVGEIAENDSGGPELEQPDATLSSDSSCAVMAPLINLISAPDPTLPPEGPVGILIQANGLEGTDGEVAIYGTGAASLTGGAMAYVQCVTLEETTGLVTVDCGPDGTIFLQSGPAQEPNLITLGPEGIVVKSLEQVEVMVEENTITVDPAMIELASTPSSVSITPEGITLTCGPCSIAITPEGITITGPTVTVSGDAAVSVSGAAVTIGP